jgi:hypothetical protein
VVGSGHQLVIKPSCVTTPSPDAVELDEPTAEASISPSHEGNVTSPNPAGVPLPAIEAAAEPSEKLNTPAVLCIVA